VAQRRKTPTLAPPAALAATAQAALLELERLRDVGMAELPPPELLAGIGMACDLVRAVHDSSLGVMVLDCSASLRYANRAAKLSLQMGAALRLSDDTDVRTTDPNQQVALDHALSSAVVGWSSLVPLGVWPHMQAHAVLPLWNDLATGHVWLLVVCGEPAPTEVPTLALCARAAGLAERDCDMLSAVFGVGAGRLAH
jgi:hypothetical protein